MDEANDPRAITLPYRARSRLAALRHNLAGSSRTERPGRQRGPDIVVAMGKDVFGAEVREWAGPAAWFFVLLPINVADDIASRVDGRPRAGFGSVRVEVSIGRSTWRTSVFPSKDDGTYLLPVKRVVRDAEHLTDGSRADVTLRLVD